MLLAYVVFYFLVWDFLPEIGALRELREFAPNRRHPPPPPKVPPSPGIEPGPAGRTSCPTTRLLTDFVGKKRGGGVLVKSTVLTRIRGTPEGPPSQGENQ